MAKEIEIEYRVTLTFDVDAKGDSSVYKEISERLLAEGLIQTIKDSELPENLYFGTRKENTPYEGTSLLESDIQAQAKLVSKFFWGLVNDFFHSKKLEHKIFVSTYPRSTSGTHYTS